jgi:hypothetical protein
MNHILDVTSLGYDMDGSFGDEDVTWRWGFRPECHHYHAAKAEPFYVRVCCASYVSPEIGTRKD